MHSNVLRCFQVPAVCFVFMAVRHHTCLLDVSCQVRDRAAERELADLRKANKQERQQRQQQMESVWDDKD